MVVAASTLEAPWLVRHGPTVFWLALVAVAALTATGLAWWTRRKARRLAIAVRDELFPVMDIASPSDELVTLRGRLRLEGTSELRQGGGTIPIPEGARAYLERDGRVFELELPAEVRSGSTERWTLTSLYSSNTRSRSVRPGDDVLVRGRLVSVAEEHRPNDFRGEAPLQIVGSSSGRGAKIALATPGRARAAVEISILGAVVGALLFAVSVRVASEPLRRAAWAEAEKPGDDRATKIATYVGLASLWPRDREATIFDIESGLRATSTIACDGHLDRAKLAASLELYRTGDCVDVVNNVGAWCKSPESLAEIGASCGTPSGLRGAAFARYLMGDFAAASDLLAGVEREHGASLPVHSRNEILARAKVHVLARRYDRAAAELRRFETEPGLASALPLMNGSATPRMACAADLAAFLAGDAAASERLRERSAAPDCALAYAETLDGEARVEALRHPSLQNEPLAAVMRAPLDPSFSPTWLTKDADVQFSPGPNPFPPRPDFLVRERSRREFRRKGRNDLELEAWLSTHVLDLVMLGADFEANEVARRSEDISMDASYVPVEYTFAARRAYVELLTMQPLTPLPARNPGFHSTPALRDLEGVMTYFETGSFEGVSLQETLWLRQEEGMLSLLEAASGGDGAAVVANRPPYTDRAFEAALVERKIARNREAVAAWLGEEEIGWRQRCFRAAQCSPEFVVAAASALARAANAYHAEPLATVEGQVASAFRDALLEPRSAVLFVLLR